MLEKIRRVGDGMRYDSPRILEKARHKVIELSKTIGKWIIEALGRSGVPQEKDLLCL